ncbi:hypothetical protein NQ317_005467 [Molorchus minor]|uniref:CD80-like immunoglobulin C2-set domain-containing protein n=1 Tax=Molorchus minor TaxID=1323400 RepID=A0ABQ9IQG8_9CUCU|nr:hypothetical protein NQ317_005467 [Molorchus minor]
MTYKLSDKVILRPLTIKLIKTVSTLVADKRYEVTCKTAGSRPAAIITWYKGKRQLRRTKVKYVKITTDDVSFFYILTAVWFVAIFYSITTTIFLRLLFDHLSSSDLAIHSWKGVKESHALWAAKALQQTPHRAITMGIFGLGGVRYKNISRSTTDDDGKSITCRAENPNVTGLFPRDVLEY